MTINRRLNILTQVIVWMAIFLSPLLYLGLDDALNLGLYGRCMALPVCMFIAYYVNYLWAIPTYLFKGRHGLYIVLNIVMVLTLTVANSIWVNWSFSPFSFAPLPSSPQLFDEQDDIGTQVIQTLHTLFNLCVSVGIATLVRQSVRWVHKEDTIAKAATAQREAELENLRYQINPHFLLNTLNNIYALTAFDQTKAQSAIMELSKMLRHILYEHNEQRITMKEEVAFIHNYVNLMRLRLSADVEIVEDVSVPHSDSLYIAPMLLISLVENAFKHGISPTQKSFIHIHIRATREQIACEIANSNHPKAASDKSGSGIGLHQVQRRLDLLYQGQYTWEKGTDTTENTYTSKITLYDTQLHHH